LDDTVGSSTRANTTISGQSTNNKCTFDIFKDDLWFRDRAGRYLLFRGINFAARSKLPPYLPILPLSVKSIEELENIESADIDNKSQRANLFDMELDNIQPYFSLLKTLGFNIIRLLLLWKALDPKGPSNYSMDIEANIDNKGIRRRHLSVEGQLYLSFVRKIIDNLFYDHGIMSILDFHQDIAHEVYNGDGFPDWAIAVDEYHERPPYQDFSDRAWASRYCNIGFPFGNKNNLLVRKTLQSFWLNKLTNKEFGLCDFPVRTYYEQTIGLVARFFKSLYDGQGHPGILGYEPFNEPHPVGFSKKFFEQQILVPFYSSVLKEIRAHDNKSFLFIEPRVDWTVNPACDEEYMGLRMITSSDQIESFLDIPSLAPALYHDNRVVFSFHYYDPWTMILPNKDDIKERSNEWSGIFRKMSRTAISRGLIPFLTEFGGNQDWVHHTKLLPHVYHDLYIRAYMDLSFQQVEANLLNATYWVYDLYNTPEYKDNWNCENFSVLGPQRTPRHLDILARPYPIRSSGKPVLLFFDLESKHCAIILEQPFVDEPTIIYVPCKIHYQKGYEVRATSSKIQWDGQNQLLSWQPDKSKVFNQLIISDAGFFDENNLPISSRELLQETTSTTIVSNTPNNTTGKKSEK
jgi:hypothetical protein